MYFVGNTSRRILSQYPSNSGFVQGQNGTWTLQLSLGLLKQVKPSNQPWLAIIDHAIDIGTKKALGVLGVPVEAGSGRGAAIQLQDCECIGLKVCEQVSGESIALDLAAIPVITDIGHAMA